MVGVKCCIRVDVVSFCMVVPFWDSDLTRDHLLCGPSVGGNASVFLIECHMALQDNLFG